MHQACEGTIRLYLRRSKASDFSQWTLAAWSSEYGHLRRRRVQVSRAVTERIELMTRSSSVRVVGSVGREERSSSLLRKFRVFVKKLRLYQDSEQQPQDGIAADVTNEDHEKAQSPVGEPSKGRSSDISRWDSEVWDVGHNENEKKGSETGPKYADHGGHSSRDRNQESQEFDPIYVLPKAATQARALADLGIPFTEQTDGFVVAAGLVESQLFDIMQVTRRQATQLGWLP